MRLRRGVLLIPAVVGVIVLSMSALAMAAPVPSSYLGSPGPALSSAHRAALRAEAAMQARMVAREHPHAALKSPAPLAGTAPGSSSAPAGLTNVQQVSQD